MRKILVSQDYQVELANNSKSALLKGMKTLPNLIILNLTMSTAEGFEVKSYLQQEPKLAQIPILLFDENSCVNNRSINYLEENTTIHQPFDIDLFLVNVRSLLQTKNIQENNNYQQKVETSPILPTETLFSNLNKDDPLYQEQQELEFIQNNCSEAMFLQALSNRGYEIVNS